jgi:hypothetical protein
MNWEMVAQIGSVIFMAISRIIPILKYIDRRNPRQRLIEDMDILSKTPESFPQRAQILEHVGRGLSELYGTSDTTPRRIDWNGMVLNLTVFALVIYWTFYLSWDGFSVWSIVTVGIALIVAKEVVDAARGKVQSAKDKS